MTRKHIILGLLIGLIGPFLVMYANYLFNYSNFGLQGYIDAALQTNVATQTISVSVVINLATFYLFIRLNKDMVSRGILLASFLFTLFVMILMFNR